MSKDKRQNFTISFYFRKPSQVILCVLFGDELLSPRVENTPDKREKKSWQERQGLSSLLHIRCVCDRKVSLMRHSWCTLKKGLHLIAAAPRVLPKYQHKNTAPKKTATDHWCSPAFLSNKRLTFAVLHIEHCTLYFCQRVPLTFTSKSTLRAPERMMWRRRLPKIGCLFISYVQSSRYCLLYLNIYIYFSPEQFAWNEKWRCLG